MVDREDLELALRRNRGRLIRAQWLTDLSKACRIALASVDLLDLAQTARLKSSFVAKLINHDVPPTSHRWIKARECEAYAVLAAVASRASGIKVVLFSSVDDLIGACVVDAASVLEHGPEVWKVVKHDLGIMTMDGADGLCLESNYSSEHQGYSLELSTWGRFVPAE